MQTFWQASWRSNPALWKCYNQNNSMELWSLSSTGWAWARPAAAELVAFTHLYLCLCHRDSFVLGKMKLKQFICICVSQGQLCAGKKKWNKTICPSQWRLEVFQFNHCWVSCPEIFAGMCPGLPLCWSPREAVAVLRWLLCSSCRPWSKVTHPRRAPTASTHSAPAFGEESLSLVNHFIFSILKKKHPSNHLWRKPIVFSVTFSCISLKTKSMKGSLNHPQLHLFF